MALDSGTYIYTDAKLNVVYSNSLRAKRVTLKVNPKERNIKVTVPGLKALPTAKNFVEKNKLWITQQLELLPPAQPFEVGGFIMFHGKLYLLNRISSPKGFKIDHERQIINVYSPDISTFSGRIRRLLISEARSDLDNASIYYASKLHRKINKISIRDTATRWGRWAFPLRRNEYAGQIHAVAHAICDEAGVIDAAIHSRPTTAGLVRCVRLDAAGPRVAATLRREPFR